MARVYQVHNRYYSTNALALTMAGRLANTTGQPVDIFCCTIAKVRISILHLAMLNHDRAVWCAKARLWDTVRPGKSRQAPLPCNGDGVISVADSDVREDQVPSVMYGDPDDDDGSDLVDEAGA